MGKRHIFKNKFFDEIRKIHFVGIGGSGMSPLAEILHAKGYIITGSDVNPSDNITRVETLGINVIMGQNAANIDKTIPDLVVYTSAVGKDNEEVLRAKSLNIKLLERGQLLGMITHEFENCVAIAGTHGKTTTTSMVSQILIEAEKDPTVFIGGRLPLINANGRAGKSNLMICEACEFQDHYLSMNATISVILNVDADHLDYFGTIENVIKSFNKFAEQTKNILIINKDDENTLKAVLDIKDKKIITYSKTNKYSDWYAGNIEALNGAFYKYDLYFKGKFLENIQLGVPGEYNVSNSLGAIAAAYLCGATPKEIALGLLNFKGAGRRFEFLGEFAGVTIVDDYAHHPTEITATLTAAHKLNYNNVWAVFQPFTFTRTARHLDGFIKALSVGDNIILSDIMGSREKNITGVSSKDITSKIDGAVYLPTFEEITEYVARKAEKGDLVITMGGGDVYKCARMIGKALEKRK